MKGDDSGVSGDIEGLVNSLLCDKTVVRAAVHRQQLRGSDEALASRKYRS